MTASKWLTAAQTAALLSIGRRRLRTVDLPFVRVGRSRYYRRSDVQAYRPVSATNRRAETASRNFTKHPRWIDALGRSRALSDHELFETWRGMINRCYVGHDRGKWDRYGGRGIRVYVPWHDPLTFIIEIEALLGRRPKGRTLDRVDVDGNYEPSNVRWATDAEQAANRGSVFDRPICFCRFDCSSLPGVCPVAELPWAAASRVAVAQARRIEAARDEPLHSLVQHVHTGDHDDCFACVRQDPFDSSALLDGVMSPREHCAAAAGYTQRHLAPLGLLGL